MAVWGAIVLHGWQARKGRLVGIGTVTQVYPAAADEQQVAPGGEAPAVSRHHVAALPVTVAATFDTEDNGRGRPTSTAAIPMGAVILSTSTSTGSNGSTLQVSGVGASGFALAAPPVEMTRPDNAPIPTTETTSNPLSTVGDGSPLPLPVPVDSTGLQLSAAEAKARKERSDRARASMRGAVLERQGQGGGSSARSAVGANGRTRPTTFSSAFAELDLEAAMQRRAYLDLPEVHRFLDKLGTPYTGEIPSHLNCCLCS